MWLWVKHLHGWPLAAESMGGAFLYNRAPYVQSFVEVRVEESGERVRVIPHGANGQLRWRVLETFGTLVPTGKAGDEAGEFIVPMSDRHP